MTVSLNDIKFRKSVVQTDTTANGGRMGSSLVVSGARHALFPRVTKSQRTIGLTRYRKEFWCNENISDESAYGVMIYLMKDSNADDRFYLAEGTQDDTQSVFNRTSYPYDYVWTGSGQLQTALNGGETSVALTMPNNDYMFPNDGYLFVCDYLKTAQTIDSDVVEGDSIYYSGGSWSKVTHTDNITYPYGWCASSTTVISKTDGVTNEEYLQIAKNEYSGEDIGDGNGSDVSPVLTTLAHKTNGVCRQPGLLPVVLATIGGVTKYAYIKNDGTVNTATSYASAGTLNMTTGVWTTPITWDAAPDNGTNILITYCENAWSWSGNVVTVELQEQIANAYLVANTFGGGCIFKDEVVCNNTVWTENTVSGSFDETNHPLVMYNDGTVFETWTLTKGAGVGFSVSGAYYGALADGATTTDYSPLNPDTGIPYFTLSAAGWGAGWAEGETLVFNTIPSAVPVLLEEVVPAGCTQEPNNFLPIGSYTE